MSAAAEKAESRRRYVLFYDIHSWTGIIGGLIFFICCYTGVLALFEHELGVWEDPATRVAAEGEMLPVDALFERAIDLGHPSENGIFVELPHSWQPVFRARFLNEDEATNVAFDPYTGQQLDVNDASAFAFLTHLHTDLHLPRPWGRYLVGLIGIFMLMSIFAGVMAHPKIFKEMFLFRWRRSIRLSFSDLHKQLGVWGLVFSVVLAFTGAVIGLLNLFAPVMVLSAFGGNVERAVEAYSGPPGIATGNVAEMLSLDDLKAGLEVENPGHTVSSFFIDNYGDEGADVALNLNADEDRHLLAGTSHRFSLVTGEPIHVASFDARGLGSRIFGAVQPLHYGLFGGMGLKLVYLAMGIVMSLSVVTGSMVWLERRADRRKASAGARPAYFWLSRLTLGVCLGLVLASVLAILAGRLAPSVLEPVFWLSWLACIALAYVVPDTYQAVRGGLLATAGVLIACATSDLVLSEVLPPAALRTSVTMIALALLTAGAAFLVPGRQPSSARRGTAGQAGGAVGEGASA